MSTPVDCDVMPSKNVILGIVIVLIILLAGVGVYVYYPKPGPAGPTGPMVADTLTIGTTDRITQLDPAKGYDFYTWEVFHNVMGGLLEYEPGTAKLTYNLADSSRIENDGTDPYDEGEADHEQPQRDPGRWTAGLDACRRHLERHQPDLGSRPHRRAPGAPASRLPSRRWRAGAASARGLGREVEPSSARLRGWRLRRRNLVPRPHPSQAPDVTPGPGRPGPGA